MRITILGSAAGGGFPQWNCNCRNCAGVRSGAVRAKSRTQSSIFVRPDDGDDGILFNASPDILQQIRANPLLQPARRVRDTAIAAVVLIDGQVDHATGLLMLRERGSALPLWCADPVAEDLSSGLPLLRVLDHYCGVQRQRIPLDGATFEVPGVPTLTLRALPLSSKAAPYSPLRCRSSDQTTSMSSMSAGSLPRLAACCGKCARGEPRPFSSALTRWPLTRCPASRGRRWQGC